MISIKPTEKKIRIKMEPSIHMKDAHYALIFSNFMTRHISMLHILKMILKYQKSCVSMI